MRRHPRLIAVLVLTLLLDRPSPGETADETPGLLATILRNDFERRGDYDALARDWIASAGTWADDPRVELAMRQLATIHPRLRDASWLAEALETLVEADTLPADAHDMALAILIGEHRRAGRDERAEELERRRGSVRSWLVIGPFGKRTGGSLGLEYPPDVDLDPSDGSSDGWQSLAWREVTVRPFEHVDPGEWVHPRSGTSFFAAALHASEPATVRLTVETNGALIVRLGGKTVLDDTLRSGPAARARSFAAELAPGATLLSVKTDGASFVARVTDERGRELDPSRVAIRPLDDAAHDAAVHALRVSPLPSAADEWSDRIASGSSKDALELLGAAILYRESGLDVRAVELAEAALGMAPDDPFVLHQYARTLRDAGYLPTNLARNRAESAWKRVRELDPDFLPVYVHLGRYLLADDKATDAVRLIEEATSAEPDFLYGLTTLQEAYEKLGWEADELRVVRRAAGLSRTATWPHLELARFYAAHDAPEAAILVWQEVLERDRAASGVRAAIAGLELGRGAVDRARGLLEEELARDPRHAGARRSLASLEIAAGEADRAIERARATAKERAWDPAAHRELADVLLEAGRAEDAIASLELALVLDPGALDVRESIDRLRGIEDRFWEPWDEELEDWVGRVPTEGSLVEDAGAISVLDLMVVKTYEDGSSRMYVHQAFRLLSEEAKDEIAQVNTPGEIVRLRTVLASGEELEPVAALGRSQFVMPGVTPGAFTDYAFIVRSAGRDGRALDDSGFFFQDFSFRQSFLLSRVVHIVPPELSDRFVETNLEGAPAGSGLTTVEKTVTELDDGWIAVAYEAREAARPEAEPLMPPHENYIPNVRLEDRLTWEEVVDALRQRSQYGAFETPEIRQLATEVAGTTGDPVERARALFDHVNALVPTESGNLTAVGTLLEKSGDRTTLLGTLLRAAGISAEWAWLRPRAALLDDSDPSRPSTSQFGTRAIRIARPDGTGIYCLPSLRDFPFGRVPEWVAGGTALVLDPRGGHRFEPIAAAAPGENASFTEIEYRLGTDESVGVTMSFSARTAAGYVQKHQFRNLPRFQRGLMARGYVSRLFPGAEVTKADFEGLEDEAPFSLASELTAPRLLREAADEYLLASVPDRLQLVAALGGRAERQHPYLFRQTRETHTRIRIIPSATLDVVRTPRDVTLLSALGSYSLSYSRQDDGSLVVERRLVMDAGRLGPDAFGELLGFYEAVDEAEKASLVVGRVGS